MKQYLYACLIGQFFGVLLLLALLTGCSKTVTEQADTSDLRAQIEALQMQVNQGNETVASLTNALEKSEQLMTSLQAQLQTVLVSNGANSNYIAELRDLLTNLQDIVVQQQADLAELSSGLRVVGIIDFCGKKPAAFNEVGLRMSDGTTVVFFEHGSSRFLTVLENSKSYATTDGTGCNFSVNGSGQVCDNYGCR